MCAIEAIVVAGCCAAFGFVAVTVIVIIGVREEERLGTLTRQSAPSVRSAFARRVLAFNARRPSGQHANAVSLRAKGRSNSGDDCQPL